MNMTKEDKLKLYNEAKEAYYNGVEIMSDQEFDKLEKKKVPHDIAMEKLYNIHSELSKAVIDNAINNGADLEF